MRELQTLQSNFIAKIFEHHPVERDESLIKVSRFLLDISESGDIQICDLAFGEFGSKLYELVSELDYDHPEIKYGQFLSSTDKEQISNISDYLSLCSLAKSNGLDNVISLFCKNITKSLFDVKSEIGFLKNRQNFVRLFKKVDVRESLRKSKQTRAVGFTNVDKKLYELWQCDVDFSRFIRFGNFYLQEMNFVNKKIDTYKKMGLDILAKEMESSLSDYKENADLDYYGFQRITVTMAALSLAKLHGYKLNVANGAAKITVPSNFYNFEGISNLVHVPYGNAHIGFPKKLEDYEYMPLAIPLHDIEASPKMRSLIKHLENFPEAEGKPIFDHFVIISPGPKYPREGKDSSYNVFEKSGKKNTFSDATSAKKFLEHTLIKEGYLAPVLLGEKDGRCYFICFWE